MYFICWSNRNLELELVTREISLCEAWEKQCEVYMPSECLILLKWYVASLHWCVFPEYNSIKVMLALLVTVTLLHSVLEQCSVEWDSGWNIKELKHFPKQTLLRKFRHQPCSYWSEYQWSAASVSVTWMEKYRKEGRGKQKWRVLGSWSLLWL